MMTNEALPSGAMIMSSILPTFLPASLYTGLPRNFFFTLQPVATACTSTAVTVVPATCADAPSEMHESAIANVASAIRLFAFGSILYPFTRFLDVLARFFERLVDLFAGAFRRAALTW